MMMPHTLPSELLQAFADTHYIVHHEAPLKKGKSNVWIF